MTTLHIINQRTIPSETLAMIMTGDCLVLIEDGVESVIDVQLPENCFVLAEDLESRQLEIPASCYAHRISYAQFVELCTQHSPIISW